MEINHILRPWSTCKVYLEISYPNNLQIESDAFCASGLEMRFLLWEGVRKAGFKGSGGVELSFSGFCKIAACVNLGVTLKGLRGVENSAVAVEESCVLDVKCGIVLIISSGRVLVLNCSLKARYPFCN